MQLTLNLTFTPVPPTKSIFENTTWFDAGWATACLGFTKKVEISQSLNDALKTLHADDEDDYDQQLYDALWLAHHYLVLDQRPSFAFTFDFLRDDKLAGKFKEDSLRIRVETQQQVVLLGLAQDF